MLLAAVIVAVAGVAAYRAATGSKTKGPTAAVFVAKRDIPKFLPGQQAMDQGYIKMVKVRAHSVPAAALKPCPTEGLCPAPGYIDSIRGDVAVANVPAAAVLVDGQFVPPLANLDGRTYRNPALGP